MREGQPHSIESTLESTKEKFIRAGGYALGIVLAIPAISVVGILTIAETLQILFEKDPTRRLMESDPELRSILRTNSPGISRTNSQK